MAIVYIDPDYTGGGSDGSLDTPWTTWASFTIAGANSYLQKRGTTFTGKITVAGNGTAQDPIILGAYYNADGSDDTAQPKPIIDANNTEGNCILANGKEYVLVSNFRCINPTGTGIAFYQSDFRGSTGARIVNCDVQDAGNAGIMITAVSNVVLKQTSDAAIIGCTATNTWGHGIGIVGEMDSCLISDCHANTCGTGSNTWGVYMSPRGLAFKLTSWAPVAGGSGFIYSVDMSDIGLGVNEDATDVAFGGRSGTDQKYVLNAGVYGSLGSDEWAQSGSTIQVDIGENPNNVNGTLNTSNHRNSVIENCSATLTDDLGNDGVGIGFDHMQKDSIIRNCISYVNEGAGIQVHLCQNCIVHNCICYENGTNGIDIATTDNEDGTDISVFNNTCIDNTVSGIWAIRAPKGIIRNNILSGNAEGLEIDINNTGIDYDYQCNYNNTTPGGLGTNDITEDPKLDSSYIPTPDSPCIGAGVGTTLNKDYYGTNKKTFATDMGAVWIDSHVGSTNKVLLSSGGKK